jgi:epoxyqueuosine reductase
VDEDLRSLLGNRIYGCDDCLAVCPWNKFAVEANEAQYHAREELKAPKLAELAQLDDATFRKFFSKSPIKRIGRNQFVRNVLYAIGNSADKNLLSVASSLTGDEDPTVADAAHWAMRRLE